MVYVVVSAVYWRELFLCFLISNKPLYFHWDYSPPDHVVWAGKTHSKYDPATFCELEMKLHRKRRKFEAMCTFYNSFFFHKKKRKFPYTAHFMIVIIDSIERSPSLSS
jgi:hypothetical protein